MHKVPTLRNQMPYADQHTRLALGEVQRPGMHHVHGVHRRMPTRLTWRQVPLTAGRG